MKVKTITGSTEKTFDKKVNDFISDTPIDVVDIKFSSTIFVFTALIMYKETNTNLTKV